MKIAIYRAAGGIKVLFVKLNLMSYPSALGHIPFDCSVTNDLHSYYRTC